MTFHLDYHKSLIPDRHETLSYSQRPILHSMAASENLSKCKVDHILAPAPLVVYLRVKVKVLLMACRSYMIWKDQVASANSLSFTQCTPVTLVSSIFLQYTTHSSSVSLSSLCLGCSCTEKPKFTLSHQWVSPVYSYSSTASPPPPHTLQRLPFFLPWLMFLLNIYHQPSLCILLIAHLPHSEFGQYYCIPRPTTVAWNLV